MKDRDLTIGVLGLVPGRSQKVGVYIWQTIATENRSISSLTLGLTELN